MPNIFKDVPKSLLNLFKSQFKKTKRCFKNKENYEVWLWVFTLVIAEDLISREVPQGFVVSSKPFSRGRKQTHF